MAQALQRKALDALQQLDRKSLSPSQLRLYLETAARIERSALGINTVRVEEPMNTDDLSMEQLKRIAAGEDPRRVVSGPDPSP